MRSRQRVSTVMSASRESSCGTRCSSGPSARPGRICASLGSFCAPRRAPSDPIRSDPIRSDQIHYDHIRYNQIRSGTSCARTTSSVHATRQDLRQLGRRLRAPRRCGAAPPGARVMTVAARSCVRGATPWCAPAPNAVRSDPIRSDPIRSDHLSCDEAVVRMRPGNSAGLSRVAGLGRIGPGAASTSATRLLAAVGDITADYSRIGAHHRSHIRPHARHAEQRRAQHRDALCGSSGGARQAEARRSPKLEARKLGNSEARKLGSSDARKLGSSEARSSEARKLGQQGKLARGNGRNWRARHKGVRVADARERRGSGLASETGSKLAAARRAEVPHGRSRSSSIGQGGIRAPIRW